MKKSAVFSKKGTKAVGPYSPAVKFGNFLFLSGQIGKDPKTDQLAQGIEKQVHHVIKNIEHLLAAEGLTLDDVLKTNVYLQNMDDYKVMNDIYGSYFKEPFPARATVAVAKLPAGALIEIEILAGLHPEASAKGCCGSCGEC